MRGLVLYGINNIYTVLINDKEYQCRIKGKVLQTEMEYYNPIAVGDWVEVVEDSTVGNQGWIIDREERSSIYSRWNRKKNLPQIIAANVDLLVCVSSLDHPPFRPRFLDRLLIAGRLGNLETLILINKSDLKADPLYETRIDNYRELGYKIILCSAKTGQGMVELKEAIKGKIAVFGGQSGVGKSSILNEIEPGLGLQVGKISQKYKRGTHTTIFAAMLRLANHDKIIDTPGIREIYIYGIKPGDLRFYFPEMTEVNHKCAYQSCVHINEPDCFIKELVEKGKIHSDRYESYLRIYESLIELEKEGHG